MELSKLQEETPKPHPENPPQNPGEGEGPGEDPEDPEEDPEEGPKPGPPQNLSATALSESEIRLVWNPPAGWSAQDLNSYKIFQDGALIDTVSSHINSYTQDQLMAETTYTFAVSTVAKNGKESDRSEEAQAATQAAPVLADVLNESFEGRGQPVTSGTELNAVNSHARTNDGRPVTGWFNGSYSAGNSTVNPQFDSTHKVQGDFSARFGLADLGQKQKSGSFYHYMAPGSPWTQLHSSFYWRFNAQMAVADAYPALGSFWEGNGQSDLTYLRFRSTGSTAERLEWENAQTWNNSASSTYQYQADTWYQVFIHLDAVNHQSRLIVYSMDGVKLQETVFPMKPSSAVGTYEFGALQGAPGANYGSGAFFWFDDLKLSTTRLAPP